MHTAVLVDRELRDGARLIDQLGKAGLQVGAAFWYFEDHLEEWQLMLEISGFDETAPQAILRKVEKLRRTMGPGFNIPLRKVILQSSQSPLSVLVRQALSGRRDKLGNQYVGRRTEHGFLDEVYVYSM